jgi:hypothetical protein
MYPIGSQIYSRELPNIPLNGSLNLTSPATIASNQSAPTNNTTTITKLKSSQNRDSTESTADHLHHRLLPFPLVLVIIQCIILFFFLLFIAYQCLRRSRQPIKDLEQPITQRRPSSTRRSYRIGLGIRAFDLHKVDLCEDRSSTWEMDSFTESKADSLRFQRPDGWI